MCTATLLPLPPPPPPEVAEQKRTTAAADTPLPGAGFRLVTNRDEQHTRAEALSPEVRRFGDRTALLPVDPSSGGTWVAVNDAGLAITLLNLTPLPPGEGGERREPGEGGRTMNHVAPVQECSDRPYPNPLPGGEGAGPKRSRGGVITALMQHATAEAAAQHAEQLDAASMMPFRLLIADPRPRKNVAVVRSDGRRVTVSIEPLGDTPHMLTSSGLGDRHVEPPRRGLFDADPPRDPAAQDAFHRHRWPDRPHLSVAMHRDDARTVSRTVVEVGPDAVTMTYTPVAFDGTEGETFTAALPRVAEASA